MHPKYLRISYLEIKIWKLKKGPLRWLFVIKIFEPDFHGFSISRRSGQSCRFLLENLGFGLDEVGTILSDELHMAVKFTFWKKLWLINLLFSEYILKMSWRWISWGKFCLFWTLNICDFQSDNTFEKLMN